MSITRARFPICAGGIVAAPVRAFGQEYQVSTASAEPPFYMYGEVAVVSICGPLVQRPNGEHDDYACIRSRVASALDSTALIVCLSLDSPGGDFAGALELSRELRLLADVKQKRLVAFSNSQALSAAYAIACAAHEIVITSSAFVGSIGVWSALIDVTSADAMLGQRIVIVPSGTRKADRNPHVAITDDAIGAMKTQVDAMAGLFFDWVSTARGLTLDQISSLQGAEVFGLSAVSAGLADRVVNSWDEFLAYNSSKGIAEMSMKEALASLAKAAEGDDEDAKKAKKMLALYKGEAEEKKEEKAEGEEDEKEKASADADGDDDGDKEKEAKSKKAKSEFPEEKKDDEKKAAALTFDLAARLHALETERANEKASAERKSLLDKRPDFSAEVRASLESQPVAFVRKAVTTWPRGTLSQGTTAVKAAAATRGATQSDTEQPPLISDEDAKHIDEKMRGFASGAGVVTKRGGYELELGAMTPKQVEDHMARLAKEGF